MGAGPLPVVRVIVEDDDGRCLILQRRPGSLGGLLWCLPGGKVDYGQTLLEAASRELREETGLACPDDLRFLFYQDGLPLHEGGMHCVDLYFACGASGEVTLNAESVAHAWVGAEDLTDFPMAFGNGDALRRYWSEK